MASDRSSSTIIVGAAPSVMNRELGWAVDQFGTVVRINRFQTIGYEAWVGSRTDVWWTFHTHEMWRNGAEREPSRITSEIIMMGGIGPDVNLPKLCEDAGIKLTLNARGKVDFRRTPEKPDRTRAVDGQRRAFWSTGAYCVLYFLQHRVERLTLHGFDGFASGWHYYEKTEDMVKSAKYCPHDGDAERSLYARLAAEGKIQFLDG